MLALSFFAFCFLSSVLCQPTTTSENLDLSSGDGNDGLFTQKPQIIHELPEAQVLPGNQESPTLATQIPDKTTQPPYASNLPANSQPPHTSNLPSNIQPPQTSNLPSNSQIPQISNLPSNLLPLLVSNLLGSTTESTVQPAQQAPQQTESNSESTSPSIIVQIFNFLKWIAKLTLLNQKKE